MRIDYSVTKKTQFSNYSQVFWVLSIIPIFFLFSVFALEGGEFGIRLAIAVSLLTILLQVLPLYLLHMNYYDINKFDKLVCDFESRSISFYHGNDEINFKTDEIISVRYFMSFAKKNNTGGSLCWDNYNFCDIRLPDNKHVIITSLLVPNIDSLLEKMNVDKEKITQIPDVYSSVNKIALDENFMK